MQLHLRYLKYSLLLSACSAFCVMQHVAGCIREKDHRFIKKMVAIFAKVRILEKGKIKLLV